MSKFILSEDELIYFQGGTTYIRGPFNINQGYGYITSSRYVYCKKSKILSFIPIIAYLAKGKDTLFEFPLEHLKSIHQEKYGLSKKVVLTTNSGETYSIQFLSNKNKWITTLQDAVKEASPTVEIKEIGEHIEFTYK